MESCRASTVWADHEKLGRTPIAVDGDSPGIHSHNNDTNRIEGQRTMEPKTVSAKGKGFQGRKKTIEVQKS